jgi:DNA repair protein RecN (Recombination protein N)
MLLSLHIENIAVIHRLDVDFSEGFSALTGETGAGKSVIIDSIRLLLGAKAERELIRTGESSAMVSGMFGRFRSDAAKALDAAGISPDEDGMLLVQRSITADGHSSIRINGRAANLSMLRLIMPALVSIHGQNDTRSLMESDVHLSILDAYGGYEALLAEYKAAYVAYDNVRKEKKNVSAKAAERERRMEMLSYQIRDIDALALEVGEEERLVDEKVRLKSSERILKHTSFVYKALRGSDKGSVSLLLDRSIAALTQISDVIPKCAEYAETLRDCMYSVMDIAEEVAVYSEDAEVDPTVALNDIESRLADISTLKRKYGLTISEILAYRDRARAEYEEMENADELLSSLEKQERAAYRAALALADSLHEQRVSTAARLELSVKETLEFLDMPKTVFFASVKEQFAGGEKILYPTGSDTVEFFVSANRGADPKPIAKIASGGELARIMLALKSALSDKEGVATLIFDEIDAGVSGKTARKIGLKMHSLSETAQIFVVTHSAQIASLADTHFLIEKKDVNGITKTGIRPLDRDGRIGEISRILGGIEVTDAQKNAAIDMIERKEI